MAKREMKRPYNLIFLQQGIRTKHLNWKGLRDGAASHITRKNEHAFYYWGLVLIATNLRKVFMSGILEREQNLVSYLR